MVKALIAALAFCVFAFSAVADEQQSTVDPKPAVECSAGKAADFLKALMETPEASGCQVQQTDAPIGDQAGQGCCSWHGGQCGCSAGQVVCCDGQYSPTCGC